MDASEEESPGRKDGPARGVRQAVGRVAARAFTPGSATGSDADRASGHADSSDSGPSSGLGPDAGSGSDSGPAADAGFRVVEPTLPRRARRPADMLRCLLSLALLAAVVLLAAIAQGTFSGLQADVQTGTQGATQGPPGLLIRLAGLSTGFILLTVPIAFAIERLLRRDGVHVAIGLLASVVTLAGSYIADEWLLAFPEAMTATLMTQAVPGTAELSEPVESLTASLIAFITAAGMARRPRWLAGMWGVLALYVIPLLAGGKITPVALIVTILFGVAVGHGILYAVGVPNTQPSGTEIVTELRRMGLRPVSGRRIPDGPLGTRRYTVGLADEQALDVHVLDRDQQVAGMFYRLWRNLRLTAPPRRPPLGPIRSELEREALTAYAARSAGARTPALAATVEIGPDSAVLAYEHVDGWTLEQLSDDEITDELMQRIWHQMQRMQEHRLAHRNLIGESVLIDATGSPWLTGLRGGEIAAGDLVLRMDVALLLTTLALRAGPQRAVRAAAAVLGPDTLAKALPLLQPIALARDTRTALRKRKQLLPSLREQILALRPQVEPEQVKLERFRPRTLISIILGATVAYVLLSRVSEIDVAGTVAGAHWGWGLAAVVAAGLTFLAATFMLRGFVPEKLPLGQTILSQLAAAFVTLVTPSAAVGHVAINTRFLQKKEIPPRLAVASVGASQLTGLVFHILLLFTFGYITGTEAAPSLTPTRAVITGILAAAVLALVVLVVPPLRRLVVRRLRELFSGVVPRLLDVVQSPWKISEGVGGILLMTLAFATCLYASVMAFGGEISFAAAAVVYMAGNALGSAAPTPGGLGAVEAAMIGGLTVLGVSPGIATSAVLLFRLLTFWLPVLPGWWAFTHLQRREAL